MNLSRREDGGSTAAVPGLEWLQPPWLGTHLPAQPCHWGSHTALRLCRENKAGSEHTETSLPTEGSSWPGAGGLCAPHGSQGLSESLCGAWRGETSPCPRGRCSGPGPLEAGQDSKGTAAAKPRKEAHSLAWQATGPPHPLATHKAASEQPGWRLQASVVRPLLVGA